TISPLRTPRDGAWPTPRILIVPSVRPSPTTTQIFEVPISRPTMRSLLAISLNPFCFAGEGPLSAPALVMPAEGRASARPGHAEACPSERWFQFLSSDEPELLLEFAARPLRD